MYLPISQIDTRVGSLLFKISRVALATFTAIGAIAGQITFTFSTTATGTLGDRGFSNALLTITSFADTSLVTPPDSNPFQDYEVIAGASIVNIAGFATATFSDPILWSDQNASGDLVVLDLTSRLAILGFTSFGDVPTYNFQSSLRPQFGAFDFVVSLARNINTFPTNAGLLSVTKELLKNNITT